MGEFGCAGGELLLPRRFMRAISQNGTSGPRHRATPAPWVGALNKLTAHHGFSAETGGASSDSVSEKRECRRRVCRRGGLVAVARARPSDHIWHEVGQDLLDAWALQIGKARAGCLIFDLEFFDLRGLRLAASTHSIISDVFMIRSA